MCAKTAGMKNTMKLLLLVLLTVTPAAAQKLEKANPAGLSKPAAGTYTQIVRAGKLLFIAGQTATNSEGKVVGPGMKEQVDQVFANLLTALKSQGADFSQVVKMTTYVTSISEFRAPDVAAVRARWVGSSPPANTLVQIQQLADRHIRWKLRR